MPLPIPLFSIIKGVVDGVFRWKESQDKLEISRQQFELMKTQLENDLRLKMMEEMRKPESEFRKFMLEYEGSAAEQSPFMRGLRSSVRPVVTYWSLVIITAIIFGWVDGTRLQANFEVMPDQLWQIFTVIFGFWFGGRALQQIAGTWRDGDARNRQVEADVRRHEADRNLEAERLRTDTAKVQAQAQAEVAKAAKPTPSSGAGDGDFWWMN